MDILLSAVEVVRRDPEDLEGCETLIVANYQRNNWLKVGAALLVIHDTALFKKSGADSFSNYISTKADFGFGPRQALRLLAATKLAKIFPPTIALPTSERQVRALVGLEPRKAIKTWVKANLISQETGVPLTHRLVESVLSKDLPASYRAACSDWRDYVHPQSEYYRSPHHLVAATKRLFGGDIDLDPCSDELAQVGVEAARFYTAEDDGLQPGNPWAGRVYVFPPVGMHGNNMLQGLFLDRAINEFKAGRVTEVVLLLKVAIGHKWFAKVFEYPHCFLADKPLKQQQPPPPGWGVPEPDSSAAALMAATTALLTAEPAGSGGEEGGGVRETRSTRGRRKSSVDEDEDEEDGGGGGGGRGGGRGGPASSRKREAAAPPAEAPRTSRPRRSKAAAAVAAAAAAAAAAEDEEADLELMQATPPPPRSAPATRARRQTAAERKAAAAAAAAAEAQAAAQHQAVQEQLEQQHQLLAQQQAAAAAVAAAGGDPMAAAALGLGGMPQLNGDPQLLGLMGQPLDPAAAAQMAAAGYTAQQQQQMAQLFGGQPGSDPSLMGLGLPMQVDMQGMGHHPMGMGLGPLGLQPEQQQLALVPGGLPMPLHAVTPHMGLMPADASMTEAMAAAGMAPGMGLMMQGMPGMGMGQMDPQQLGFPPPQQQQLGMLGPGMDLSQQQQQQQGSGFLLGPELQGHPHAVMQLGPGGLMEQPGMAGGGLGAPQQAGMMGMEVGLVDGTAVLGPPSSAAMAAQQPGHVLPAAAGVDGCGADAAGVPLVTATALIVPPDMQQQEGQQLQAAAEEAMDVFADEVPGEVEAAAAAAAATEDAEKPSIALLTNGDAGAAVVPAPAAGASAVAAAAAGPVLKSEPEDPQAAVGADDPGLQRPPAQAAEAPGPAEPAAAGADAAPQADTAAAAEASPEEAAAAAAAAALTLGGACGAYGAFGSLEDAAAALAGAGAAGASGSQAAAAGGGGAAGPDSGSGSSPAREAGEVFNPRGTVVVYIGKNTRQFCQIFGELGHIPGYNAWSR
ncbi:hypothetical protein Agub_g4808 [Astrephomene gubernaculifera]|uniref:Uncharacterized protein n=1 Tax=Astrephomene gubernaculifera TaxID=47775 RepID=A0AAD3HK68_9CHLO|nr:hypothetical protein Agub_g4808 [Astrephomene gubernaculifera]